MDDPEVRAERRLRREQAIVRRERILETARRLKNRYMLEGGHGVGLALEPGSYGSVFVMRPETLDFILRGQGGLHEGEREFRMGDRPLLDKTPVYFSKELELDQVILAYEGWPYFGPKDFPPPELL